MSYITINMLTEAGIDFKPLKNPYKKFSDNPRPLIVNFSDKEILNALEQSLENWINTIKMDDLAYSIKQENDSYLINVFYSDTPKKILGSMKVKAIYGSKLINNFAVDMIAFSGVLGIRRHWTKIIYKAQDILWDDYNRKNK